MPVRVTARCIRRSWYIAMAREIRGLSWYDRRGAKRNTVSTATACMHANCYYHAHIASIAYLCRPPHLLAILSTSFAPNTWNSPPPDRNSPSLPPLRIALPAFLTASSASDPCVVRLRFFEAAFVPLAALAGLDEAARAPGASRRAKHLARCPRWRDLGWKNFFSSSGWVE
jgi:hypothetical protein